MMRRFAVSLAAVSLLATPVLAAQPSPKPSPEMSPAKVFSSPKPTASPAKGAAVKKPDKVASATSRSRLHRHRHTAPTEAPKVVTPDSVTK